MEKSPTQNDVWRRIAITAVGAVAAAALFMGLEQLDIIPDVDITNLPPQPEDELIPFIEDLID